MEPQIRPRERHRRRRGVKRGRRKAARQRPRRGEGGRRVGRRIAQRRHRRGQRREVVDRWSRASDRVLEDDVGQVDHRYRLGGAAVPGRSLAVGRRANGCQHKPRCTVLSRTRERLDRPLERRPVPALAQQAQEAAVERSQSRSRRGSLRCRGARRRPGRGPRSPASRPR